MNELHRMQYLEAMGVDSYVPRFILPVAKAPSLCSLPEEHVTPNFGGPAEELSSVALPAIGVIEPDDEQPVHSNTLSAAGSIAQTVLAGVQSLAAKSISEPEDSSLSLAHAQDGNDTAAIVEDTMSLEQQVPATFSLAMWWVDKRFYVIDSRRRGDALPTQTLLRNILKAMGMFTGTQALPSEEILNWPMIQSNHDQSWSAATQMVQGFLDARILTKPVANFLLFGEDACFAVLGKKFDYAANCYRCINMDLYGATACILPSLASILYSPETKKDVWQGLLRLQVEEELIKK